MVRQHNYALLNGNNCLEWPLTLMRDPVIWLRWFSLTAQLILLWMSKR